MPQPTRAQTARERVRSELTAEIKDAARRQLAAEGAAALSLRAVARDLGMVSSALYRYFPSRDALLTALIIDAYASLGSAAEQAEAAVRGRDVLSRWMAVGRAVRLWALTNPHEYALVFGSPVPGYAAPQDTVVQASRVPALLSALMPDVMAGGAYGPAGRAEGRVAVPRRVHRALAPVRETLPAMVPDDLVVAGLMAWTYLFGAVSFEVFGHRTGVISDPGAFFEFELLRIAELLGLVG